MSAPDLGWYLRRLRGMSPVEVVHRSADVARQQLWRRRQVLPGHEPAPPADLLTERRFASVLPASAPELVAEADAAAVVRAAEEILAGEWLVLGTKRTDSADPDWFFDPVTGRRAPDTTLAFAVHHRDEGETGNIKQIWEMSRHHHLTVLAAAWWVSRDDRFATCIATQLRSWWKQNPLLSGVNWTSGIEAGVRLMSWVWIRRLLDDWAPIGDLFERNDDALRQIAWHHEFLAAFRSRGSSANNHVIAEAAGQLAAACAFPWYARSKQWRRGAAALLERELDLNTFPDGLNRELATDYHRFVLELCLVAAVEADAAGHPLSDRTWSLLTTGLDAAAAILDVRGGPPRQGDGDEGRALIVDDPERDPWAVLLDTGARVFDKPAWWPETSTPVEAVVLSSLTPTRRGLRPAERPREFADAGMVILRSRPEDGPEIWCRCDGGPHGFLSIAAHGHADALSIELRHEGVELLIDPGTYCYHGEREWRDWFRSTAAHNTIEVDGTDQAVSGGPFMWTTLPQTQVVSRDLGDQPLQSWTAEHDGYRRLGSATDHRRTVSLDSPHRQVLVTDTLHTTGSVPVLMSWNFGPDVDVHLDGNHAQLTWRTDAETAHATMRLPASLRWSLHRGETQPITGWYSPRFGVRVPAPALAGRGTISGQTDLLTEIELP